MTENELRHHGIIGQKWGVRRFQNPDGTLTEAGKKRYADDLNKIETRYGTRKDKKDLKRIQDDPILNGLKDVIDSKTNEIELELEKRLEKIDMDIAKWFREEAKKETDPKEKEYDLNNAYEYEHHNGPRDFPDYEDAYYEHYSKVRKAGEDYIRNILGEYANQKIKGYGRDATDTAINLADLHLKR